MVFVDNIFIWLYINALTLIIAVDNIYRN